MPVFIKVLLFVLMFGIVIFIFAVLIVVFINWLYISHLENTYGKRVNVNTNRYYASDDFLQTDFVHNLEWKLKSIFMADDVSKVKSFVKCDVKDIILSNGDIVDSSLTQLNISKFNETEEFQEIEGEAILRNYKYIGDRVKCVSEKYQIKSLCKKEVMEQDITAMRQYVCRGCGSSIDVFGGSLCRYCNEAFDYADMGWVITDLKYVGRKKSEYPRIVLKMLATYMTAIIVTVIITLLANPAMIKSIQMEFDDNIKQEYFAILDSKNLLHEVSGEYVEFISQEEKSYERTTEYIVIENSPISAQEVVFGYRDYLLTKWYSVDEERETEGNKIYLVKSGSFADMFVYFICCIEYNGDSITIYESLEVPELE